MKVMGKGTPVSEAAKVTILLRTRRERVAGERYMRGYRQHPESDEEVAATWAVSGAVLAGEPWE